VVRRGWVITGGVMGGGAVGGWMMEEGGAGWGGGGGAGVARGRRGHGARRGGWGSAARRAQLDFAWGARTRGARAAWREAVLTGRSFRGARRCSVIGCVPGHRRSRDGRRAPWNTSINLAPPIR